MNSAGWVPLPLVAVAEFPLESVTVRVTESGCPAPSSVLFGPPHVQVYENVELDPVCARCCRVPSVHCTDQEYDTSWFVPAGNDVDSSVHVLALLLVIRHSVVGVAPLQPGSNIRKP